MAKLDGTCAVLFATPAGLPRRFPTFGEKYYVRAMALLHKIKDTRESFLCNTSSGETRKVLNALAKLAILQLLNALEHPHCDKFVNLMFTISRASHTFTAVLGNYLHQLLFNVCQAGFRSGATGQDKRDVAP